jgi:Zn-finger protein
MDVFTKKCIEMHVSSILDEFNFGIRKEHTEKCPCYPTSPCHKMEDLNCFLCYCPWYANQKAEGGCELGNPLGKGKWFEREFDRIWDCSDCEYPHKREVVEKFLRTPLIKG